MLRGTIVAAGISGFVAAVFIALSVLAYARFARTFSQRNLEPLRDALHVTTRDPDAPTLAEELWPLLLFILPPADDE
jgi:hypothetical protein